MEAAEAWRAAAHRAVVAEEQAQRLLGRARQRLREHHVLERQVVEQRRPSHLIGVHLRRRAAAPPLLHPRRAFGGRLVAGPLARLAPRLRDRVQDGVAARAAEQAEADQAEATELDVVLAVAPPDADPRVERRRPVDEDGLHGRHALKRKEQPEVAEERGRLERQLALRDVQNALDDYEPAANRA